MTYHAFVHTALYLKTLKNMLRTVLEVNLIVKRDGKEIFLKKKEKRKILLSL
jgi:hypothetical protein